MRNPFEPPQPPRQVDRLTNVRPERKPEPFLTIDEAIAHGIIDPAALRRPYIPQRGVTVIDWDMREETFYPNWDAFKADRKEDYLGIPKDKKRIRRRDVPSGMREPLIDLGPGVTDAEYRAARGFLVDQGIAQGPEE